MREAVTGETDRECWGSPCGLPGGGLVAVVWLGRRWKRADLGWFWRWRPQDLLEGWWWGVG